MMTRRKTSKVDMKLLLDDLVKTEREIEEIYLFGSRAYRTGSHRSDCDLIIRIAPSAKTKSSDLRDFATSRCSALDFFLCTDARAVSCANDSYVFATTFGELVEKLDAILLWTRVGGFTDFAFGENGSWVFEVAEGVDFFATVLPGAALTDQAWIMKSQAVEALGLPTRPYIGDSLDKSAMMIGEVARRMIVAPNQLGQHGQAKAGWTVNLQDEYDCQNLFYSVVKPWLPELGREEIAIYFDGQRKISDFSLFDGKLIIEMKFIDCNGSKAAVVKTLDGLRKFYKRNGNVGFLLFVVYLKEGTVDVDSAKWEAEYSHSASLPRVLTMVVRVP